MDGLRRPISRLEIWRAARAAMRVQGIGKAEDLRPEDLHIQTTVWVAKEDAGLQVEKTDFDAVRQRTVFRLRASKEPRLLPFDVTTDWTPFANVVVARHSLARGAVLSAADVKVERRRVAARLREAMTQTKDVLGQQVCRSLRSGQVITRNVLRPPVLVTPGKPATLIAVGPHMRISTKVIPLQPGFKGQLIRIRNTLDQRIMKVQVVAAGLLKTNF